MMFCFPHGFFCVVPFLLKRGGHRWDVHFGRRDSIKASLDDANKFLPPPNSSLEILVSSFQQHGLDTQDLVALSGNVCTLV